MVTTQAVAHRTSLSTALGFAQVSLVRSLGWFLWAGLFRSRQKETLISVEPLTILRTTSLQATGDPSPPHNANTLNGHKTLSYALREQSRQVCRAATDKW